MSIGRKENRSNDLSQKSSACDSDVERRGTRSKDNPWEKFFEVSEEFSVLEP